MTLKGNSMLYLRDCLEALPSLHTLEIAPGDRNMTGLTRVTFKDPLSFPSIRKVTIPLTVHPILSRLPNLEELVCFSGPSGKSVKPLLGSLRGPYLRERNGEVEPVLKSFRVISPYPDSEIAAGM